ncbi:MAG: M23 family metallopeptidase [Spirochaetes bacterium]|nr:M23 family metallopeptidase [Spirochaetota bacterium]
MKTRIPRVPLAALLLSIACVSSPADEYPEMKALTRDDPLYMQLQAELDTWYRLSQDQYTPASERPAPSPLAIFTYRRRTGEDLFSLNARLNLPYDTLVTLNAAASRAEFDSLARLLVPTRPGIFVSDPPATALEDMMLASRVARGLTHERIVVQRGGRTKGLWFFPGESFNAVERAYFLQILYDFPIVRGKITSRYGSRADPFTGEIAFHNGIDIGAPEGTAVHAARDGIVAEVGASPVLGTYVVITHPGGWQTVYGHLSSTAVAAGANMALGALVGSVGSTGKTTGPHLHFEVRRKGSAVDPFPLLALKKG